MFTNFREKERNIDWVPSICGPSRDWIHNLGMCPDWELNLQPFGEIYDTPTN